MRNQASSSAARSRRRAWKVLLLVLVFLALLTPAAVTGLSMIAEANGCRAADPTPCSIGPIASVVQLINLATKGGYFLALAAPVWLLLSYIAIYFGWCGFLSRLVLAVFVNLLSLALPFAPILAILPLDNPDCRLTEGRLNSCRIFGNDLDVAALDAGTLAVEFTRSLPLILMVMFAIFLCFLILARLSSYRTRQ
jgi:hypothetical protein